MMIDLERLLRNGGIFYNIMAASPKEALSAIIAKVQCPGIGDGGASSLSRETLLTAVLEREDLMTTAQGRGLAFPHPRNPVIANSSGEFIAAAVLENKIDWHSLDGKKVDVIFLLALSSARNHLAALSALNYICRDDEFLRLLRHGASRDEIFAFIKNVQRDWRV